VEQEMMLPSYDIGAIEENSGIELLTDSEFMGDKKKFFLVMFSEMI